MIDFCTFVIKCTAEIQAFPFVKSIYVQLPCEISYPFMMNIVR